jgi:uncharacterized protein (TIGR02284 family)
MDMQQNMELLNDLVLINNDRIAGYEKALKEIDGAETELRTLFTELANDSRKNVIALRNYINENQGDPSEGPGTPGNVYSIWTDVQSTFDGHDPKAILASCELSEKAAQKAYQAALDQDSNMSPAMQQLISNQLADLKSAAESVRNHKLMQPAQE